MPLLEADSERLLCTGDCVPEALLLPPWPSPLGRRPFSRPPAFAMCHV